MQQIESREAGNGEGSEPKSSKFDTEWITISMIMVHLRYVEHRMKYYFR